MSTLYIPSLCFTYLRACHLLRFSCFVGSQVSGPLHLFTRTEQAHPSFGYFRFHLNTKNQHKRDHDDRDFDLINRIDAKFQTKELFWTGGVVPRSVVFWTGIVLRVCRVLDRNRAQSLSCSGHRFSSFAVLSIIELSLFIE